MVVTQKLVRRVSMIARHAGMLLMQSFGNRELRVQEKSGDGLVTSADTAAETYIIKELHALDQTVAFVAEESGHKGKSDWEWVIDPLDGTSNFVYGIPYFCVSIALTYHGQPQLGVIYNPVQRELFWACKNGGAWCGKLPMHVASRSFEKSLIALSVPYDDRGVDWNGQVRRVSDRAHDVRRMGAAALDLAYVAVGHFDCAFFQRLSWWDIAAGVLLIQEAGGIVTDFERKPIDKNFISLIAATPTTYEQLFGLLTE